MKVKLNELRIGNWVNVDGKAIKIQCIDQRGWINYPEPLDDIHKLVIGKDNVHAIPITKEIIEKLGFKKTTNFLYELEIKKGLPFCDKLIARIKNGDFENWVSVKHPINNWEIGAAVSFHQLQNLYFAIAEEEIIGPYGFLKNTGETWIICHQEAL